MPLMGPWQQQQGVAGPTPTGVEAPAAQQLSMGLTPQQLAHISELLRLGDTDEGIAGRQAQVDSLRKGAGAGADPFYRVGANAAAAWGQEDLDEDKRRANHARNSERAQYMKAMNGTEAPDISALLYANESDAPAKAQALAAALRQREAMANMAVASGDPRLSELGKNMLAGVKEAQGALVGNAEKYQGNRFTRGENAAAGQRHTDDLHYNQGQENFRQGRALEAGKYTLASPTPTSPGYVVNNRTGEATPLLDAAPGKPGKPGKDAEDMDKALEKLKNDLDPSRGRNGLFGQDQGLVTAAQKVKGLVKHPKTGEVNYNLTVEQVPEFIQNVAGMLANGGHAAQGTIEHLYPQTAGLSVAKKMEWLTGHPEVANVPEFVKQFYDTAEREEGMAHERIRNVQLDRVTAHQGAYGRFPEQMKATARQYLKDLADEDLGNAFVGKYDRAPKAKAPAGLSADEAAEFEALHKKYGGAAK